MSGISRELALYVVNKKQTYFGEDLYAVGNDEFGGDAVEWTYFSGLVEVNVDKQNVLTVNLTSDVKGRQGGEYRWQLVPIVDSASSDGAK